ncbi:sugar phosphate isomerase/epimerase family protein, partial [Methylobacterium goesingense]
EPAFEALLKHTVRVARMAEQLSQGGGGVFGAPRNRLRGRLSEAEAFELGAERFAKLAKAVSSYGFTIMLEPAPPEYGGDFLRTERDCAAMVQCVAHPAFRLHVDTGCLTIAGEDGAEIVAKYHNLIGHIHLSQPSLAPVEMSAMPTFACLLRSLREAAYSGWTAIEMRESDLPMQAVEVAIRTVHAALPGSSN